MPIAMLLHADGIYETKAGMFNIFYETNITIVLFCSCLLIVKKCCSGEGCYRLFPMGHLSMFSLMNCTSNEYKITFEMHK